METLLKDIRYGVRGLIKKPLFTLVAVITLALGIGANTAIFSLVNALLLRSPAGVAQPEQLVLATWEGSGLGPSYPDYLEFRDRNTSFAGLATFSPTTLNLSTDREAERTPGALVSGNYFNTLEVKIARGRGLSATDDTAPGANPVVVISDALWCRRFNADASLVGQSVRINGFPFTVVGIAPPEFTGVETGRAVDVWLPLSMAAQADPTLAEAATSRVARGWLRTFGRLKPGVSLAQAQAEMSILARTLEQTFPDTNKDVGVTLLPNLGLGPKARNDARSFSTLIAAIAGLVLLIACANVANLLLARGQARRKEIAIRLALGATRLRLIRQLLTENLLLALLGGGTGAFLAVWLSEPLRNFVAFGRQRYPDLNLTTDKKVLGFTLVIAVLTGLLFGLIPTLHALRTELTPILKNAARTGQGKLPIKVTGLLVIGQIALSVVVLIVAGLFVRTLRASQTVPPGFNAEHVLTATLDLGKQGYSEDAGRQFYQRLSERVDQLPGVRSATMTASVPLSGATWNTRVRADNQPPDAQPVQVDYNVVAPHYFSTLEIPFLSGRDFSAADNQQAPQVVILNETLARRLFPAENPLGRRVIRFVRGEPKFTLEVVGVVKDSKYRELTEPQASQMYLPLLQNYRPLMTLAVRSEGNAGETLAAMTREVRAIEANLPVFNAGRLADQLHDSLAPQRSVAALIGTFGLLALALASIGLYGVMAYTVSQNTREIGIRMALGAQTSDVMKLVVKQGLLLTFGGVGIGLVISVMVTRLTKSVLFGVTATDPATFVVITLGMIAVALLACYFPARKAVKVDPLITLRYE